MPNLVVVNCPHCTIEGASDGRCHNNEHANASGVNYSCKPCMKAAEQTGERFVGDGLVGFLLYDPWEIVTCRICRGMKKVFVNPETREILPFVIPGSED